MNLRASVAISLLLGPVGSVFGSIFSYECDVLPTEGGWTLAQAFCGPQEWIQGSLHFQQVNFCEEFPGEGQQFDYSRVLSPYFIGAATLFLEWRVETTGDQSELTFVAPAVLVIGNNGSVNYHVTISKDRIKLNRDNLLPLVFADIEAGVPHTYRFEFISDTLYVFYIDGIVIDSGVPEGSITTFTPQVNTGAKAKFVESLTTWDYIRWGDIPQDLSGDFNSDGLVDDFEVFYIDECVNRGTAGELAAPSCAWADVDGSNTVNCDDWTIIADNLWTGLNEPPDLPACSVAPIPAVSTWGIAILALLTLTVGSLLFRRSHRFSSPGHPA